MASNFLHILLTLMQCYQVVSAIKCNGMEGLCDLRLNEVTLPGTHNSGSGFNGHLYHWRGGIALSRYWRNQQWDFTRQLDYGIRYFDIDTCYVHKDYDGWWTKGAWICHMGVGTAAYAGPVKKMLKQINDWLKKPEHANEVIVIKFGRDVEVDYKPDKIYQSILDNLNEIGWKPTPETKKAKQLTANNVFDNNNFVWPTLREAIDTNQRVFLFLSEKLLKFKNPSESNQGEWLLTAEWEIKITWPNLLKFTASCSEIVPKLVEKCDWFRYDSALLELDVFGQSATRSTWTMQASCDKYMQKAMDKCFELRKTSGRNGRTVNAVLADWVNRSKSPNTVLEVARKQNHRNIAMFKKRGSKRVKE